MNENAEVRFDGIEKEHAALRVNGPKESPQTVLIFLVRFFIKKKMNEQERDSYVANALLPACRFACRRHGRQVLVLFAAMAKRTKREILR